jgi:hypothetical protein
MARESLHHASTATSFTTKSVFAFQILCPKLVMLSLPIKFVAAEAGFLPPGPCMDFADMLFVVRTTFRVPRRRDSRDVENPTAV